jgi:tetratricopeptide (TPR) repeat protein
MTMEEYNQAEKYRNLAEEKNKEIKDTMTEIGIYYNKGILLENKKKYKEAEKKFIHGLDLSNQKNTNVTIKN